MFPFIHTASRQRTSLPFCGWQLAILLLLWTVVFPLVGCQTAAPPATVASATAGVVQTATATSPTAAVATAPAIADPALAEPGTPATGEALPPVRLAIPAIDFATPVEPMAWGVTDVEGERQAVWEVPEASAGWHINSAAVGATGNMVLSGHHRQGTAVFAPLARGEIAIGDQLYVTDSAGRTFIYQISESAEPIPVSGTTTAERERLEAYQGPTSTAKLTLLTGWPDFSDTHYLIIVADLVGELE
jgi:hypothetical protein